MHALLVVSQDGKKALSPHSFEPLISNIVTSFLSLIGNCLNNYHDDKDDQTENKLQSKQILLIELRRKQQADEGRENKLAQVDEVELLLLMLGHSFECATRVM